MKNARLQVLIVLLCLLTGWNNTVLIQAKGNKQKTVSLNSIEVTNNGGTVTVPKKNANFVSLVYDTTGLKDGYYSSFVHVKGKKELEKSFGLMYHITAVTDVRMNINVFDNKENKYQVKEASTLYLIEEETKKVQLAPVKYGSFLIPKGFKGSVYIPHSELDGNKALNAFSSIGFVFTMEEEQKMDLSIGNITVVNDKKKLPDGLNNPISITGDTEISIPTLGEYEYSYSLGLKSEQFELEAPVEGVTISENGILTINEQAKPGTVSISVTSPDNPVITFDVLLQHPWFYENPEMKTFFSVHEPVKDSSLTEVMIPVKSDNLILFLVGVLAIFALLFYKTLIHSSKSKNKGY